MPTDSEVAWAAGLFEGEGCITLSGASRSPRLKISMTDADVVLRFARIVGGGNLAEQRFTNPKYKTQLCWYTGKKSEVIRVLNMLMHFFGERRLNRAAEVLARAMNAPFEGWDSARTSRRS